MAAALLLITPWSDPNVSDATRATAVTHGVVAAVTCLLAPAVAAVLVVTTRARRVDAE